MRAFVANIGSCLVVTVELCGALYSLKLAWSLEFHHVLLEMDSSIAVSLHQKSTGHHPYSTLIKQIQQLLARNWEVKVNHVYREASRATNFFSFFRSFFAFGSSCLFLGSC